MLDRYLASFRRLVKVGMRIVFHAWRDLAHPHAGGSERLVNWLAEGLASRGHEVLLCAGSPVGTRTYMVVSAGGRFSHYVRMPFVHRKYGKEADVVVDVASGLTYFSPWWQRSPTVLLHTHVHTQQWSAMFSPPFASIGRLIESRAIPRAYRNCSVVTISESSAAGLEELGFDRSHISILSMPAEGTYLGDERSEGPLFVCVGRLVRYKRVDRLLEMWRVVEAIVGGTLVIIGDGPERQDLERQAGRGVVFVGAVEEAVKTRLQHDAWIQVHAASHEGWGIVVSEAAIQGTPTLAFRVSGLRDSVVDGLTGVLVDDEESFVKEWIDLAGSAERRNVLGHKAKELAGDKSIEKTVAMFESLLLRAVSS